MISEIIQRLIFSANNSLFTMNTNTTEVNLRSIVDTNDNEITSSSKGHAANKNAILKDFLKCLESYGEKIRIFLLSETNLTYFLFYYR